MASSSLTVITTKPERIEWRTYGGNRGDVRGMKRIYEEWDYVDILDYHPNMTREQWESMELYTRFNKS